MRVQGQRWSGARWVGPLAGDRGHLAKETWMEQFEGKSALFGFGFVQPPLNQQFESFSHYNQAKSTEALNRKLFHSGETLIFIRKMPSARIKELPSNPSTAFSFLYQLNVFSQHSVCTYYYFTVSTLSKERRRKYLCILLGT